VVQHAEVPVEPHRPAFQRRAELAADRERQIDVRPPVALAGGERPGDRGGNHAPIVLGVFQQELQHALPIRNGEHRLSISSGPVWTGLDPPYR
jgi:hypothetical protein